MYDLIYTNNHKDYREIWDVIKKEYPDAELEDGSDGIHENRFSVKYDIEQEPWFVFIINNGFAMLSLNFQLQIRQEPDKIKELIDKTIKGKLEVKH